MQLVSRAALLATAALALAFPASLASAQNGGFLDGPCRADAQRLCPDAGDRAGQVADCLLQHASELQAACTKSLEAREQRRRERAAAVETKCAEDFARLCADAEAGDAGPGRCLREHEAELSEACRDVVAKRGDSTD